MTQYQLPHRIRSNKYLFLIAVIIPVLLVVASACMPEQPERDPFLDDQPIWAHKSTPNKPEVVFFRRTIETDTALEDLQIHIFADTRYEVWMDGRWIGRGPARFSQTLHEYDIYHLDKLEAGQHLIAVLVQWAPNIRRSESVAPFLKAHLQARTGRATKIIASTGNEWQVYTPKAWQQDAAPVDTRGLIGPTELLDLRLLPKDWNQPGYDDKSWENAQVQSLGSENKDLSKVVIYRPRSIPLLANVPVPVAVQDAGLLSPGFSFGELLPSNGDPYSLQISALQPTIFTLETLSNTQWSPMNVTLDGNLLNWLSVGPTRPDVSQAAIQLTPGAHSLSFSNLPPQGITIAVTNQDTELADLPFQQGVHAGRRLLLSEPFSAPSQVRVDPEDNGLNATFTTLPAYLVLDLGRTSHGRLQAEINGPSGTVVDIGWDERLRTEARRPLPYPGSLYPEWNQVDSWVLDGQTRTIATIDARAGRYILIAVWGTGPVGIRSIQVFEEGYPVKQVGSFHSSDPLLDKIWQVGVDSLRPNMTDAFTDTPWRERGLWWGDAYVENFINQVAFGDPLLMRRCIDLMVDALSRDDSPGMVPNNNGQHMLDYTMLWVDDVATYLWKTQSASFSKETYPAIKQFMGHLETFQNPATGLLDLPKQHWSQTAYIESFGFDSRYGQSTALNALYYNTLLAASDIAEQYNDAALASKWRQKANQVKDSLNDFLYLPDQHRYLSSFYENEPVAPSPHSQAWPLVYGLVPDKEVDQVAHSLEELLSHDPGQANVQTYGMFWVLEALGRAGHISQALDIIKLYYGYLLDRGATTWWENFIADQRQKDSFSHGWGGSPTWFLTSYVLGARELTPNYWQVKPAFEDLRFASGSIPLRSSNLEVYWIYRNCGNIYLSVISGEFTQGKIVLPWVDPDLTVKLDGEVIWNAGKPLISQVTNEANQIYIALPGGKHELEMQWICHNTDFTNTD